MRPQRPKAGGPTLIGDLPCLGGGMIFNMIEATKDWQSRLLWQEQLSWELLEAWADIVIFTQTSITTQTKREESCLSSSVPRPSLWTWLILRPNSWTKSRQKFSSLLFTVTSTALPWDFYFFKLTQPLPVSTVHLRYTVKEQGGKPERILYPLPYCLRIYTETSSLRNLKIMPISLNEIVCSRIRPLVKVEIDISKGQNY